MWRVSSWEPWASAGSGESTSRSRATLPRFGADSVYVLGTTLILTFTPLITSPLLPPTFYLPPERLSRLSPGM